VTVCFVLLQLARFACYWSLRDRLGAMPLTAIAKCWLLGLRFDASATAMVVSLPTLMLALPFPVRWYRVWWRAWHGVACAGLLVLALACIADYYYLAEVRRHIGQEVLTVANDMGFIEAFAIGPAKWGLLLLVFAATSICWGYVAIVKRGQRRMPFLQALLILLTMGIAVRGSVGDKPLSAIDAFDVGNYELTQLELNGAFSMARALDRGMPAVSQGEFESALAHLKYAPEQPFARHANSGERRNVVIFLLESWSASYVDAFRSDQPLGVTPVMDQLAHDGVVFSQFYAAGQRSYEGIQAVLAGLPALPGVPTLTEGLSLRTSRLGDLASKQGIRTIFTQASPRRSLRLDSVAEALGFSEYYGREDNSRLLLNYADVDAFTFGLDHETMQGLADRLHDERKPFLAFLFSGSTHTPVAPIPAELQSHYSPTHPDKDFLDAMHYSDWGIGQFMARARTEPWFDNTVFIFLADHTRGNDRDLRARFHIPMVIYAPKIFSHRVDTRIGSQVDIFDTVVDLLGLEADYSSAGHSLLAAPVQERVTMRSGENIGLVTPDRCFMYTTLQADDSEAKYLAAYRSVLYGVIQRNSWAE